MFSFLRCLPAAAVRRLVVRPLSLPTRIGTSRSIVLRDQSVLPNSIQTSNIWYRTLADGPSGSGSQGRGSSKPQQDKPKRSNDDDKEENGEGDEQSADGPMRNLMVWTLFLTAGYLGFQALMRRQEKFSEQFLISWNDFVNELLAKGEVSEIIARPERERALVLVHSGCVYKGQKLDQNFFLIDIGESVEKFEERIREEEARLGIHSQDAVNIQYRHESIWGPLIAYAFIMYIAYLLLRSRGVSSAMKSFNPSEFFTQGLTKASYIRVDAQTQLGKGIGFKDVAGLREAKIEIMEFVDYLKNPLRFKELGARLPRGALLLGPPGTGKTLLAKAVATEARVPFLAMAGSEFVEMLGGLGASRVRDLFKEAKRRKPCIVFIDEIDAIGRKRAGAGGGGGSSGGSNLEEEHTLNQLLVEMDGMKSIDGVIVFAATNRSDILDAALMRPGRFDRHIYIDLPTMIERKELFEMYLKKIKLRDEDQSPKEFDAICERMAQMTPSMTGADIANIGNEAAIRAATEGKSFVGPDDLEYALAKASTGGVEKRSGTVSPQERRVIAVHEAGHAVLAWLLLHAPPLLKLSIAPRTSAVARYSQYMPQEHHLYSTEMLFDRMVLALGGRAAEAIVFNHISTSAQDDLRKVTRSAYDQVRRYGMSEVLGPLSFPVSSDSNASDSSSSQFAEKPYSRRLGAMIDEESRKLVAQAYRRAEELLRSSRHKLDKVAGELQQREALRYEDLVEILGKPVNEKLVKLPSHTPPPPQPCAAAVSDKEPQPTITEKPS